MYHTFDISHNTFLLVRRYVATFLPMMLSLGHFVIVEKVKVMKLSNNSMQYE